MKEAFKSRSFRVLIRLLIVVVCGRLFEELELGDRFEFLTVFLVYCTLRNQFNLESIVKDTE